MVRQGQGRDVLRTAYDKVNDAVGIKQSERKPGVIIRGGGAPLLPPPVCHSDPGKEDEVEGGNSGERRDEEANADAIVTLVVAVVAAKQVASCRKGVIVVYGTEVVVALILVKVQLSVLSGSGFGDVLVHGLSLFSAPSVQFCTESVTHPRRYKLNNSFHCDKFVLSVRA